jgi:hypothetical protein
MENFDNSLGLTAPVSVRIAAISAARVTSKAGLKNSTHSG